MIYLVLLALFVLSWDPNHPDQFITSYRIYRSAAPSGVYSLLKTVKTTQASVSVLPGQTRCWKVKAVNILGQASPYSGEVCRTVN